MKIDSIKGAQNFVKNFVRNNDWEDYPNIDKFDHLHEELIEMSRPLRYKSREEMVNYINNNKSFFEDGVGDLFFGICRLANQLGVDVNESFNLVKNEIVEKYSGRENEQKISN